MDSKNLALDTWNVSWSNFVLVQQVLVVYWANVLRKENSHHVFHAISGESMCSNNCLLQFTVCVALCNVENLPLVFSHLIRSFIKVAPSVKFISSNHYSSTTTTLLRFLNSIVGCVVSLFLNYISSKFWSNP